MINKTAYLCTDQTVPYRNLALEEVLLRHVEEGQCIFYLWQNRHTVVIGKNQNARQECKVDLLEEEDGFLARRLSGGGAVFHDLGNLNFTFLIREEDYDVTRQCSVILEAVRSFGVEAEQTGRNDILAEGRKFSGNAFYKSGGRCYHHGTIMIAVDMDMLSRYLNVSMEKMRSKGVKSVKARVTNLSDLNPAITVESMTKALLEAFNKVYGCTAEEWSEADLPQEEIRELTEKYASLAWREGEAVPFSFELHERYDWGDLTVGAKVQDGKIAVCRIYSDGMDALFIPELESALVGCEFTKQKMLDAVEAVQTEDALQEEMRRDLTQLIRTSY